MERVSERKEMSYTTFDEALGEQLRDAEFASGYLELAIPDGPQFIMRRLLQHIKAGVDIS